MLIPDFHWRLYLYHYKILCVWLDVVWYYYTTSWFVFALHSPLTSLLVLFLSTCLSHFDIGVSFIHLIMSENKESLNTVMKTLNRCPPSLSLCSPGQTRRQTPPTQKLAQCLAHKKAGINIYWLNELIF